MSTLDPATLWDLVHSERAALARDLHTLDPEQWHAPTLCAKWDVEHVVAHLVAAATTTRFGWLRSMIAAGLRPSVHNERRLSEHLGPTPRETLAAFRDVVDASIAPTGDVAAFLGEVVVHAQDIRRPLGITTAPSTEALTAVAEFYATKDFAVPSKTIARGLRLRATDGPFAHGSGADVAGSTLALVMTMAARPDYLDELDGAGTDQLRDRVDAEQPRT